MNGLTKKIIFVNRRMQKPQMPKIISTTTMMIDTSPHVGMPISWANASVISAALSPSFSASPLVGVAVLKSSFSSETSVRKMGKNAKKQHNYLPCLRTTCTICTLNNNLNQKGI
uniref:Uncharacterized protein n=1 Tax=Anopheles melas TaxID=34690 RepID=A0A182U1M2_9DIPT